MPSPKRPSKKSGKHQLRVIGGEFRRRKIDFGTDPSIRPTPDRIRETLFNWLQHELPGAKCLELYAGSGILSIEALSRGAAHATIIDHSKQTLGEIEKNLNRLKVAQNRYHCQAIDANTWLSQQMSHNQNPVQWDIIFLDPPFSGPELANILPIIAEHQLLASHGCVYIESEHLLASTELPSHWILVKQKQAAKVHFSLCQQRLLGGE